MDALQLPSTATIPCSPYFLLGNYPQDISPMPQEGLGEWIAFNFNASGCESKENVVENIPSACMQVAVVLGARLKDQSDLATLPHQMTWTSTTSKTTLTSNNLVWKAGMSLKKALIGYTTAVFNRTSNDEAPMSLCVTGLSSSVFLGCLLPYSGYSGAMIPYYTLLGANVTPMELIAYGDSPPSSAPTSGAQAFLLQRSLDKDNCQAFLLSPTDLTSPTGSTHYWKKGFYLHTLDLQVSSGCDTLEFAVLPSSTTYSVRATASPYPGFVRFNLLKEWNDTPIPPLKIAAGSKTQILGIILGVIGQCPTSICVNHTTPFLLWGTNQVPVDQTSKPLGDATAASYQRYNPSAPFCPFKTNYAPWSTSSSDVFHGTRFLNRCGPDGSSACFQGYGTAAQGWSIGQDSTKTPLNSPLTDSSGGCSEDSMCPSGQTCCQAPQNTSTGICFDPTSQVCDISSGTPQKADALFFLPEAYVGISSGVNSIQCVNFKSDSATWNGNWPVCKGPLLTCDANSLDQCVDQVFAKISNWNGTDSDKPICPVGSTPIMVGYERPCCPPGSTDPGCVKESGCTGIGAQAPFTGSFNWTCQPIGACTSSADCGKGGQCEDFVCTCNPKTGEGCKEGYTCTSHGYCEKECSDGWTRYRDSCMRVPPIDMDLYDVLGVNNNDIAKTTFSCSGACDRGGCTDNCGDSCLDIAANTYGFTTDDMTTKIQTSANSRQYSALVAQDNDQGNAQVYFVDTAGAPRRGDYYFPAVQPLSSHYLPETLVRCVPKAGAETCDDYAKYLSLISSAPTTYSYFDAHAIKTGDRACGYPKAYENQWVGYTNQPYNK